MLRALVILVALIAYGMLLVVVVVGIKKSSKENNISDNDLQALRMCKYVHLFIRKVDEEHGIRLPFIYVGEGYFSNERKQEKIDTTTGKENTTYLYDIPMNEELPDYLQYDFGLAV